MASTCMECADVKGKAMPPIPPANRLLQVLFVKARNTAMLIGTADGIAFLWAVLTDDQGDEIFLGRFLG